MRTIDFNEKVEGKKRAAFVILYALDGMPWSAYPMDDSGRHGLTIPVCLMINRSDGAVGFIGGMVEEDESLEQAAIREVKEEIGHAISLDLEPIVAHDIGHISSHAFAVQMSYLELRKIQDEATRADHFGSEITGIFLPHLIDYERSIGKHGGLVNLIQTSMAPSLREELVHFLLRKGIFSQEHLSALCEKAGYSLDRLLK